MNRALRATPDGELERKLSVFATNETPKLSLGRQQGLHLLTMITDDLVTK